MPALEIAVTSASAAMTAIARGADRIELCSALELGGVTPPEAVIDAALEGGVETHVLVRARPGDFVYDGDEVAQMEREAATIASQGAAGVVIGALRPDGRLDLAAIARIAGAARTARPGVAITVHRAVDSSADPVAAIGDLVGAGLGIGRVLTSGGAAAAGDGIATIAGMIAASDGNLEIMSGGGVTLSSIPGLVAAGVDAVHMSAKRRLRDHFVLDPQLVAAASALLAASA
ncbi:MAG: copper homeostasis protein CutC [Mycobacterium sp.]